MADDNKTLSRTAQRLVVEVRRGHGSPPAYDTGWQVVWGAKVDRIEINKDNEPSTATIWFPDLRWNATHDLLWADMVRIRTDEYLSDRRTVIFHGFVTAYLSDFSGGTEQQGTSFERNAVVASDHRWLLQTTSPLFGQIVRGPDDYTDYGTESQTAIDNSYTWATAQRAIFNADGKPNKSATDIVIQASDGSTLCDTPIFDDPDRAEYWTAGDMIRYVLCPLWNKAYNYLPITDPALLTGLDHDDWSKYLNHIVIDSLNVLDAVELISRNIGWSFRLDFTSTTPSFVFYKTAAATGSTRSTSQPNILHSLYAPEPGASVSTPVSAGKKILWSMSLAEDIRTLVNNPWGIGAPQRFEFTAELVPAWLDTDLVPDTADYNEHLYLTEADLQDETAPNEHSYYQYYHPRGSGFKRSVGRKWALNESARYTAAAAGDRGTPFDFAAVVAPEYILNSAGKRNFAPFNRQLLPALTVDSNTHNSVGIKVEFSFDAGSTWQTIPAAISPLRDECGIYIDEVNLAELVDESEAAISGGDLDGVQLNYWTSLCSDKLAANSFKDGQWNTRVRVTASVQLDQRLNMQITPSSYSGSPFMHSQLYDFSEKYGITKRTASSQYASSSLAAYEQDSTDYFSKHLESIRRVNEDMSISGQFTLERLWLGDGAAEPAFAVGDGIEKIEGREYKLATSIDGAAVYPEIIKIIYLPDKQHMRLITRDLRFASEAGL